VRLRAPVNRSPIGRCAALGLRARPAARPQPTVTFLNGRYGDISKWWTHYSPPKLPADAGDCLGEVSSLLRRVPLTPSPPRSRNREHPSIEPNVLEGFAALSAEERLLQSKLRWVAGAPPS
jgi:hypothetical protein